MRPAFSSLNALSTMESRSPICMLFLREHIKFSLKMLVLLRGKVLDFFGVFGYLPAERCVNHSFMESEACLEECPGVRLGGVSTDLTTRKAGRSSWPAAGSLRAA